MSLSPIIHGYNHLLRIGSIRPDSRLLSRSFKVANMKALAISSFAMTSTCNISVRADRNQIASSLTHQNIVFGCLLSRGHPHRPARRGRDSTRQAAQSVLSDGLVPIFLRQMFACVPNCVRGITYLLPNRPVSTALGLHCRLSNRISTACLEGRNYEMGLGSPLCIRPCASGKKNDGPPDTSWMTGGYPFIAVDCRGIYSVQIPEQ